MRLVRRTTEPTIRNLTYIAPVSVRPMGATLRYRQMLDARERLFEGLDGHTISTNGGTWRVRVYSICEEPGGWWLQLALEGNPEYTVTLRTLLNETAPETLGRLSRWLGHPSPAEEVLTIA